MIKIKKKIIAILMLLMTLFGSIQNVALAKEIGDSAYLKSLGNCNSNLEFKFDSGWSTVICHFVTYTEGGKNYPAYCISHGIDGVDEHGSYSVDLTKILDDERLYRVIINGYPYKTPAQLGVADKYDAYMATKQAIYSVILNRNVRAMYRGKDGNGNKVVDLIEKLTNIGRNGTQTYKTANLKINRTGGLTEEGNYYSQRFSVSSAVEVAGYNITSTSNMPSGSFIADVNGNKKTSFNSNADFKLMIPKSSMNKNINTSISIKGRCKTYPVFYGKTTVANTQNYAVTGEIEVDYTAKTTLDLKLNTGSIRINKTDEENSEPMPGITFELSKEDGTVLETKTTDEKGMITFSNLYEGKYILKETATDEMHVLRTDEFKVDVKYNKTTTENITNERIKGQIRIIKTSEDDNFINEKKAGTPIENVKFEVYDSNKNKVDEIITDKEGIAITRKLDKGNYFIKEVQSGEWYLLNEDEFSAEIIKHGEIIDLNITNESEKPDVDIEKIGIIQTTANEEIKYDFKIKNTGNVPLSKFAWYDYLPTDYVRVTKLVTGTYNQDLNYSIYYKTNKNDYRLLKDNLNTKENNYIDFSKLKLESDEYITEFKADFGTVDVGFESDINPYIFVKVNSNVKDNDTFTNKTRIEGYNKTYMVWDEDNHTTKVYEKNIKVKKLPRTGM